MRVLFSAPIFCFVLSVSAAAIAKEAVGVTVSSRQQKRQSDSLHSLCGGAEAERTNNKALYDCVEWHRETEEVNLRQLGERCGGVKALSQNPQAHEACVEANRVNWPERTAGAYEACGRFSAFVESREKYQKCYSQMVKRQILKPSELSQLQQCPSEIVKLKTTKFDPKKSHKNGMAMLVLQTSHSLDRYGNELYAVDRQISQPTLSVGALCAALARAEAVRVMTGEVLGILSTTLLIEQISDFEARASELSSLAQELCDSSVPSQTKIDKVGKTIDGLRRSLDFYRKRVCL